MNAAVSSDHATGKVALLPMAVENLAAVHSIERELYDFPWTIGNFKDSIAAGYDCREYRAGDTLIGYVVVMAVVDEVHLLNLSIARSFHRQGHGSRLLTEMLGVARQRGARSMMLEVRPSNAMGLALYEKFGFVQLGVRRGYYPALHGREDALVLSYAL